MQSIKNNSLIKLAVKILLLLSILVVIDFAFGQLLGSLLHEQTDGRYFKIEYSLNKCNEDVIIIGSSRAEANYNPSIIENELGLTCWNAGRGGQGLAYFYSIEASVLSRYSPKLIIVNIDQNALEWPIDYDKSAILRPFVKQNPHIKELFSQKDWSEKYKLYSNIYAYNSAIFYFLRPFFIKGKDGKNSDKGWKPLEGQINSSSIVQQHPRGYFDQTNNLNPEKISLLNKMISLAQKKNCELIFVFSPDFYPPLYKTSTNVYFKKLNREKNIKVIDLSADKQITGHPNYYKDIDHLNHIGADIFTKRLIREIRENSFII